MDVLELQGRARDRKDPRLVGRPERLRRVSPLEMDGRHEGVRRARGGVLSRPRAAPPGSAIRAVVPLPLADALLLRRPGRPRRPDRSRLRGRQEARLRARAPTEEATARRAVEPRRGPTGPEPGRRALVRGASEQASDPARVRDRRPTEQDDHAPGAHGPVPGRLKRSPVRPTGRPISIGRVRSLSETLVSRRESYRLRRDLGRRSAPPTAYPDRDPRRPHLRTL